MLSNTDYTELLNRKLKCDHCKKRLARIDKTYGVLWCDQCNKEKEPPKKYIYHEFIPDRIKEDRKRFKKDLLQPHREGEPSREFIEAYPKQARRMFTSEEIKKARNVWTDL